MMVSCAVSCCKQYKKNKTNSSNGIILHSFPKDEELRAKWVNACRRVVRFNPDTCRVCSEHFDENDYVRDLYAELLNINRKKKLKNDAVPHLKLSVEKSVSTEGEVNKILVKSCLQ